MRWELGSTDEQEICGGVERRCRRFAVPLKGIVVVLRRHYSVSLSTRLLNSADGEGGRLEIESRAWKLRPVGDTSRYRGSIRRDKKQEKVGKVQSVNTGSASADKM